MQLGVSVLCCAINGNEQIQPAFLRLNFRNIDMKVADRIFFKRLLRGFIAFNLRQAGYAVALETAMQV